MVSPLGELLTRWTVRLAVACYAGRLLVDAGHGSRNAARWLWTAGCGLYVAHVLAAFAFYHDWSHAAAYAHTAEQTASVTGWRWGGGLYVNYAFTVVWLGDVLWWWVAGADGPYERRVCYWTVQGVFAFVVFNATVVFGPWWWTVVFGVLCVWLVGARRYRHGESAGEGAPP